MSDGTQRLKKAHRRSVIMVVIVTVILLVAIAIPAVRNYRENQMLQLEQAAYEASLEEAMKRAEELKARANAVLTDEEIIAIARSRFGLVFPDEIIFKPSR